MKPKRNKHKIHGYKPTFWSDDRNDHSDKGTILHINERYYQLIESIGIIMPIIELCILLFGDYQGENRGM